MALRNIAEKGESCLNRVCRPVKDFDRRLGMLIDDMLETVENANGAGLAAPQVGVLRRVVVAITDDGSFAELINPEIIETSGEQDGPEGCLSVPGVYGMVKRPDYARVAAFDRTGKKFEIEGHGLSARAFLHEIDHLDGHLFTERVSRYLSDEELSEMYSDKESDEE